jgi:histidyl-tRNA synthetase
MPGIKPGMTNSDGLPHLNQTATTAPMADKPEKSNSNRLKARLPRGLADRGPAEIAATREMLEKIRAVYELYGFEPVETPAIEYTDALGKFLPDQDRPNEGVFSFQDDDEQWLSLRYDLTAPLARYVAENFDTLPKPYRSYRFGWVFRNEKPGPGRFRQFMQFDADTVGSKSPAADAELCMMAADAIEAIGIPRGDYVVKVSNRKVLDGVLESIGLAGERNFLRRLTVLRALDKLDRLGIDGVKSLLGKGRTDVSTDFTPGAELSAEEIEQVAMFVTSGTAEATAKKIQSLISASALGPDQVRRLLNPDERQREKQNLNLAKPQIQELLQILALFPNPRSIGSIDHLINSSDEQYRRVRVQGEEYLYVLSNSETLRELRAACPNVQVFQEGVDELEQIISVVERCGYRTGRIAVDPSVVRGLEYYTGPVFEVELTFSTDSAAGSPRFGSVGGGGRYDGLVSRFRGEPVPATGFSIGVSRLLAALQHLGKVETKAEAGPVVVTVFDRDRIADYQQMVASLRNAGIRAELYLGSGKFGPQMKYADRRNSPCVVIQGSDEKAKGEVTIKDLIVGAELAKLEKGREEHLQKQAEAQSSVPEAQLVEAVRAVLARHKLPR